jgi:hypothetical protein
MRLRSLIIGATWAITIAARAVAFDYPMHAVIYEGAVGTTKVKITASARPFDRTAHQVTELRNVGTAEKEDWRSATIDGVAVVGTDQTLPKNGLPQLSSLTIWFGTTKVDVPARHLHHVFLPDLDPATFKGNYVHTLVAFSADAGAVFISLGVGDGGGSGTYDLRVTADGTVSTEPLHRPEP